MRVRALFVILVLVTVFSSLLAQDSKKKKENDTVTFSANTELVQVPVIVTGKDGKPIRGLKKDAFDVMENGKSQTIATFEEVTTSDKPLQRANGTGVTEDFSNALEGGSDPRRIFIIFLDALNTPATDQMRARTDLIKFLAKSVNSDRLQALILFDQKGTHMVHDFTSDPAQLVAALQKVTSHPPAMNDAERASLNSTASNTNDPSGAVMINQACSRGCTIDTVAEISNFIAAGQDAAFSRYQVAASAQQTLEALLHIADVYAGVPGRKSLVWITAGFPFVLDDPSTIPVPDLRVLYELTTRRLADANIAVYPVDARGLIGYNSVQTVAGNGTGTTFSSTGKNARLAGTEMDERGFNDARIYATFREFANVTGGRAFTASNDLVAGLDQIDKDSASYYVLGYYLDTKDNRAGWRKLKVEVKGEDAKLLYRAGFFVSEATLSPQSTKAMEVLGALNSPVNAVAITMHAHWGTITPDGTSRDVQYAFGAYPGQIVADPAGQIDVDLIGIIFDSTGKQIGPPFGRTFAATLPPSDVQKLAQYGLMTGGTVKMAPGSYFVHFGIRDNKTGRLGTVIAPLTVQ